MATLFKKPNPFVQISSFLSNQEILTPSWTAKWKIFCFSSKFHPNFYRCRCFLHLLLDFYPIYSLFILGWIAQFYCKLWNCFGEQNIAQTLPINRKAISLLPAIWRIQHCGLNRKSHPKLLSPAFLELEPDWIELESEDATNCRSLLSVSLSLARFCVTKSHNQTQPCISNPVNSIPGSCLENSVMPFSLCRT